MKKRYRYMQVYDDLFRKISSGEYAVETILPSEKEIGVIHSVERTTVRKALEILVKDGMVKKIQGVGAKVMSREKITYPQSALEGSDTILFFLATTRENTDRLTQPFYSLMFARIENELKRRGYKTIYSTISESDDIAELLALHTFAGIIFASYGVAGKHMDYVSRNAIPFVTVNNDYEKSVFIAPDNFSGGYQIGKHLVELGHRKIGLLKGTESDVSCRLRLAGFNTALAEAGVAVDERYVRTANWVAEQGYLRMKEILERNLHDAPTAVFAFNDGTALGVVRAIAEFGLKVPDDISVVGFDNITQSEYVVPPLTTVDSYAAKIARTAVIALHEKINGGGLDNVNISIPVKLVIRDSTAPVKPSGV